MLNGLIEGSVASSLLSTGDYYDDGIVSLSPVVGNWNSTTKFNDGSAGDTTTGEQATGVGFSILHVFSSPTTLNSWDITLFYKGTMLPLFYYWNGSTYVALTDTNMLGYPIHAVSFTSDRRTATFSPISVQYLLATFTESDVSGGGTKCTDARPA